ncbi:hypothetical protein ACOSQ4_014013 [Xanthoceras sorbifolium]
MEVSNKEDAPVFLDHGSRGTRGKRMTKLLDEEIEEDEFFFGIKMPLKRIQVISDDIVSWFTNFLEEYCYTTLKKSMDSVVCPYMVRRSPHSNGVYKVSTYAYVNEQDRLVELSVVIRNHVGLVMASATKRQPATYSSLSAESLPIK